jgi:hypothetical protein
MKFTKDMFMKPVLDWFRRHKALAMTAIALVTFIYLLKVFLVIFELNSSWRAKGEIYDVLSKKIPELKEPELRFYGYGGMLVDCNFLLFEKCHGLNLSDAVLSRPGLIEKILQTLTSYEGNKKIVLRIVHYVPFKGAAGDLVKILKPAAAR